MHKTVYVTVQRNAHLFDWWNAGLSNIRNCREKSGLPTFFNTSANLPKIEYKMIVQLYPVPCHY